MGRVVAFVRSAAVSVTFMELALTKVEACTPPFTSTADDVLKLLPVSVTVGGVEPWMMPAGEIDVSVGTGLLTERELVPLVPPPGFGLITFSGSDLAVAKSSAVSAAVNWV